MAGGRVLGGFGEPGGGGVRLSRVSRVPPGRNGADPARVVRGFLPEGVRGCDGDGVSQSQNGQRLQGERPFPDDDALMTLVVPAVWVPGEDELVGGPDRCSAR